MKLFTILFISISVACWGQSKKAVDKNDSIKIAMAAQANSMHQKELAIDPILVAPELQRLYNEVVRANNELTKQIEFFVRANSIDPKDIIGNRVDYIDPQTGLVKSKMTFTLNTQKK